MSIFLDILGGVSIPVAGATSFIAYYFQNRIGRDNAVFLKEIDNRNTRLLADVTASNQAVLAKLGGKLSQIVHVHKVQFEREFVIYRAICKLLVPFHEATATINLAYGTKDFSAKLLVLSKQYRDFVSVVQTNKPFYQRKVYAAIVMFLNTAEQCQFNVGWAPKSQTEYQDYLKLIGRLNENADDIHEQIRLRLESLQVIEE